MATLRNLPALVRKQFKLAQESGDLTFYATRVSILQCEGLPARIIKLPVLLLANLSLQFQVRFSPALANKPKYTKPANSKPIDPFENPSKGLFISDLLPSHFLVLNKYPIIPDHFILATKEYKSQTDLLEIDDLGAAYDCLKAYKENGEELFGFFNSGEHSGASQPHRHIQFLPVESMRSGIEEGKNWSVLADTLVKTPRPGMFRVSPSKLSYLMFPELPFTYFSSPLPEDPSSEHLHKIYISLHEQACQIVQQQTKSTETPQKKEESPISYNIGLTDRAMVLCPRISEGSKVKSGSGDLIGPVALNGTILGGTLLVKSEEDWDALRSDELKLKEILYAIGIPSTASEPEGRL
jgi:ATP adenylyltransferase